MTITQSIKAPAKAPAISNKPQPASSGPTVRRATSILAALLGAAAFAALVPPTNPAIASAASVTPCAATSPCAHAPRKVAASSGFVRFAQPVLAQDQNDEDDAGDSTANKGASPDEIQKYVAVYRAMQRNHSMTVEQATAAQGLTVGAFRDLERRIESDDLARDDARRALAGGATPAATPQARR